MSTSILYKAKGFVKVLPFYLFTFLLLSACSEDTLGPNSHKLGIKTFFPTKVVTNQPVTINGTGLGGVQEIEFPGGAKVTDFEIVSEDMIRVNTPAGIPEEGGQIIVRSANDEVKSPVSLTLGNTVVSGFSKQAGEQASGGELITVYGTDLEFINSVELLDAEGVPQIIDQKDFYRKGTSNLIFRVPKKNIFKGTFVGTLHTYDGKKILMPELTYEPAADGGHWETVKTTFWKNDDPEGNGSINWSGTYRFGLEGNDPNSECIATFPADIWNVIKSGTFYMRYRPDGDSYQIRVTTGWWSVQWLGADNDIAPWNMAERIIDNGDGTYFIEINFGDDPIVASLDEQHLLFTGAGYTPLEIYSEEEVWVDEPDEEDVKVPVWTNDDPAGHGSISWSGTYRFGLEGNDPNSECIATFPEDVWNKIKTGTFYMRYRPDGDSYQIRVTTGWWSVQWLGADNDIAPWNMAERIIDNEDGTYFIEINFGDDPIVGSLDEQHLLFTGAGYTPLEIYFIEKGSGGGGKKEVVFWKSDGTGGAVSWSSVYRFALEGHDSNSECLAEFPQDTWDKIKSTTFYLDVEATDPQVRITTGWWDPNWNVGDIQPGNERLTDNGNGTFTVTINITEDSAFLNALDERHLLITGDRFTPLRMYFK